jgi:NifU-like protein involved in Fe-S cluster formation
MILRLYHEEIKILARKNYRAGRLESPDSSVQMDNPLCGDRVRIDIGLENGRIVSIAQEVKACLLCAAASSAIGKNALGMSLPDAEHMRDTVSAMLNQRDTVFDIWPEMQAFVPVAAHKSRFDCVILPFNVLCRAIQQAR